ncbi:hypothetical protein DFH08DRAFT_810295 [Mycena albidolilacea]|uniref:Uncharacterized protein n=1 Tax=Mycena albidolilacea TaxID=1033008 RepID=A0AAD6ZYX7_9AGAR|nr:hypothetical protein DFH08DRAFT_810295 [Mycena albidolilacea]
MDACDMPFFPNAGNFTRFKEHDKNPRKFWFLGLSDGLFTKKTDVDAAAGSSKVYIFFTRKEARDKWDQNCLRQHTHDGDGRVVPDSEAENSDGASVSSDENGSSMHSTASNPRRPTASTTGRPTASTAGRPTPVRNAAAHRTASHKSYSSAPKGTPPKRESPRVSAPLRMVSPRPQSRAPVKKEVVLPLWREDTPPLEMEVDTVPVHDATPSIRVSSQNPSLASSSSVSSVSSISATSSEGGGQPHPFRDLAASASTPRAAPSPSRLLNRVPAAAPKKGASVPFPPAAHASTPGSSASAAPRAHAGASNSGTSNSRAPYLYNETSRKLYKDAQKAVEEMGDTNTVQVVDYKDVVQCLSAGGRGPK